MPKIAFLSDLHCEFDRRGGGRLVNDAGHPFCGPDLAPVAEGAADALILAGDIDVAPGLATYLETVADYLSVPVIAVLGNHEFYKTDLSEVRSMAANINHQNVFLLDDRTVVLRLAGHDVRFIGSTLWTDFRINEERTGQSQENAMRVASSELNDFQLIAYNGHRFTPADSLELHEIAVRFIAEELDKPFEGPTVLVTHHSPSPLTEDRYQATPLAGSFGSNLHRLMEGSNAPVAWIHGHSHEDSDVVVGHTRVASRQRGYPGEKAFEFGWLIL